jgi:hypothetical protein
MNTIDDATIEAGAEELAKPLLRGTVTGTIGVGSELAHERNWEVLFFVLLGGAIVGIALVWRIKTKKRKRKPVHHAF